MAISGVAGGGVDAINQLGFTQDHRINDPISIYNSALTSGATGPLSSLGGRLGGVPGAFAGGYTGAIASGGDRTEGFAGGAGAVLGRLAIPNKEGEGIGAATGRQLARSVLGKEIAQALDYLFSYPGREDYFLQAGR